MLVNFFNRHQELTNLNICFNKKGNWDITDKLILASVLLSIEENCQKLRQLTYCQDVHPPAEWLYDPLFRIAANVIKNLKVVIIGDVILSNSINLHLLHSRRDENTLHDDLMNLIPNYGYIFHLTLVHPVSYVVFQTVCKTAQ